MELLQQFRHFCHNSSGHDSLQQGVKAEQLDDELGGLLEEVAQFCGGTLSDCLIYEFKGDALDASLAVRWLTQYCTEYDDQAEPEVYVASDFSFFAAVHEGPKITIFSPQQKGEELKESVPTFEGWLGSA